MKTNLLGERRGRTHNAEGAREAILNAAEQVFAENGFDGARVDVIAQVSGYNKSLIFQYYGDKLGLYVEVIRRTDAAARELQLQAVKWIAERGTSFSVEEFRRFLKGFLGEIFDYYREHPDLTRIIIWEIAEEWQTYTKIAGQIDTSEIEMAKPITASLQNAGLLYSDFDPLIQMVMAEGFAMLLLASIPMFQTFFPTESFPTPEAIARMREFYVEFVTRGLLANSNA